MFSITGCLLAGAISRVRSDERDVVFSRLSKELSTSSEGVLDKDQSSAQSVEIISSFVLEIICKAKYRELTTKN